MAVIKAENENLKKSANTDMSKAPAEDCTPYKTKAAGLEAELAAVKSQLAASQVRVTVLESEVADLKKKIGAAIGTQEDCTPYKTKLACLEAEIAKLKASQEDWSVQDKDHRFGVRDCQIKSGTNHFTRGEV